MCCLPVFVDCCCLLVVGAVRVYCLVTIGVCYLLVVDCRVSECAAVYGLDVVVWRLMIGECN